MGAPKISLWLVILLGAEGVGCGGKDRPAPLPRPDAEGVLAQLKKRQDAVKTVISESVMDYWAGDDRITATVLMMGKRGGFVRFNALNPDGGSTAADMACNAGRFTFVDYNRNCVLAGPCNQNAIQALFRVSMQPDDFVQLASGLAPLLEDATADVSWDASSGTETLRLRAGNRRQLLALSPVPGQWDILKSTRWTGDTLDWTHTHRDFDPLEGADGAPFRLPDRSRFQQPEAKSDLVVRWKSRTINSPVSDDKFVLELPQGLPKCP